MIHYGVIVNEFQKLAKDNKTQDSDEKSEEIKEGENYLVVMCQ